MPRSDAAPPDAAELAALCGPIALLLVDVDGVLTDGRIIMDDLGVESKNFHVRDGFAIALWRKTGRRVAILSGRRAKVVDLRAAELGISPVIQGEPSKSSPFRALLAELGLDANQVCYIGDDLPDIPVMRAVGLSACPADAVDEVRRVAHVVANAKGGEGAVREVVELILKNQGEWERLIAPLSVPA